MLLFEGITKMTAMSLKMKNCGTLQETWHQVVMEVLR